MMFFCGFAVGVSIVSFWIANRLADRIARLEDEVFPSPEEMEP